MVMSTYSAIIFQRCLRMASRALRPSDITSSFCAGRSRKNSIARRITLALNAPHKPAFPAHHQQQHALLRPPPQQRMSALRRAQRRGMHHAAKAPAYKAARKPPSPARAASRAAATNFIARVICCVFFTERMRRLISSWVAMGNVCVKPRGYSRRGRVPPGIAP